MPPPPPQPNPVKAPGTVAPKPTTTTPEKPPTSDPPAPVTPTPVKKAIDPAILKQPVNLGSPTLDNLTLKSQTCDEIDGIVEQERRRLLNKDQPTTQIAPPKSAPPPPPAPETAPPTTEEVSSPSKPSGGKYQIVSLESDPQGEALKAKLKQISDEQDKWSSERNERMRRLLAEQSSELKPKPKMSVDIQYEINKEEEASERLRDIRQREQLEKKIAEINAAMDPAKLEQQQKQALDNKEKALKAREERKKQREALAAEVAQREALLSQEAQRIIDCRSLWDQQKELMATNPNVVPDDLAKEIEEDMKKPKEVVGIQ